MKKSIPLKTLAYKAICESNVNKLPVDSKLFLHHLKISEVTKPFKNCLSDDDKDSIIFINEQKYLYCDPDRNYSDYLTMRILARYFLKLSDYINVDDKDIDIFTVYFMAPPVVIGKLGLKGIHDISNLCLIPPHIIHRHLDIILGTEKNDLDNSVLKCFSGFLSNRQPYIIQRKLINKIISVGEAHLHELPDDKYQDMVEISHYVYLLHNETTYHEYNCSCIYDKTDVHMSTLKDEKAANHKPCPLCFREKE